MLWTLPAMTTIGFQPQRTCGGPCQNSGFLGPEYAGYPTQKERKNRDPEKDSNLQNWKSSVQMNLEQ